MKTTIEAALKDALALLGSRDTSGLSVEYSDATGQGDLATNAALVGAKKLGISPQDLAEKLLPTIKKLDGIKEAEIAGPGFINITLSPQPIKSAVESADSEEWGKNKSLSGKRVMVEYTDPNPFKEFHIGHLMSNAIGESIARLTEYTEAETKRANYQGDVGPHVAKAIWGVQKLGIDPHDAAALGKAYAAGSKAYEDEPNAKEEIDRINKLIYEKSDEGINNIYQTGRTASLEHFEKLYNILGTKFDYYFYESESAPIGIELVKQHREVFEESDGAIVYRGEQDGLHTRVFITSHGTPTYETKDLGLLKLKADAWPSDSSIYVTAQEQQEYFKVMLAAAMRFMPELASRARHITHGMMRLPSGKMSSRSGDVITGESLLADLTEAAHERAKTSKADDAEKLASDIAVGAIKYQILRQGIGSNIIFDKEKALSLEGDSGPYIQYAYARTCSIVNAGKEAGIKAMVSESATEWERKIAVFLMRFPDVVKRAQTEFEPHHIATYATALASLYNSWYAQERVLDSERAAERLALTEAVGNTLKKSLYLLGIPAPERM